MCVSVFFIICFWIVTFLLSLLIFFFFPVCKLLFCFVIHYLVVVFILLWNYPLSSFSHVMIDELSHFMFFVCFVFFIINLSVCAPNAATKVSPMPQWQWSCHVLNSYFVVKFYCFWIVGILFSKHPQKQIKFPSIIAPMVSCLF